jgi:hypothetical protein
LTELKHPPGTHWLSSITSPDFPVLKDVNRLGPGLGQLVAADEQEGDRNSGQPDHPAGPDAQSKPPVSATAGPVPWRSRVVTRLVAIVDTTATPIAELLGGVDEPGGQAGLMFGHTGQGRDGHRDEGERGADAGDQERTGQVGPEMPVYQHLGRPEHAAADQGRRPP